MSCDACGSEPSKARILLVDDNPELLEICSVILVLDGHTCHTAVSGRQALGALDSFAPDVVVLDLGLPDITGFELARVIRHRAPHIHLIALTGWNVPEAELLEVFDRCLEKPARAATLRNAVRDLDRPRVASTAG